MNKIHSRPLLPKDIEMMELGGNKYDYYLLNQYGEFKQVVMAQAQRPAFYQHSLQPQPNYPVGQIPTQQLYQPRGKENSMPPYYKQGSFDYLEEKWFEDYYRIRSNNIPQLPQTSYVTHPVSLEDTIEGLAIQYGVSTEAIRKFNSLNTNDIFHLKLMLIPNPTTNYQRGETQFDMTEFKKQMKLQIFLEKILKDEDVSVAIATFYLEQADWDFRKAKEQYEDDLQYNCK